MRDSPAAILTPAAAAVVALLLLVLWVTTVGVPPLQARIPGTDRPPEVDGESSVPLVGTLVTSDGRAADLPGEWPRFRGPNFDGISHESVSLTRTWPSDGPKMLWSIELGEGHAGAAVRDGRVYVLDYDRQAEADVLRCLSLADAVEIWRFSYPSRVKRNHGMSRTVPAVTEKYVVALGPKCQVMCLDAKTGQCHWLKDVVAEFGATVPPWYAGQCPLIDGDRAILAPGGDALLVALDCASGNVIWKSPNPRAWTMTHSSIMPMEFAGRKMYVYCGKGGVVGVSANDGSLLWKTTDWRISIATVPSPVILPEGKIFLSGGYNSGAVMLQLHEQGGKLTAETLFRLEPKQFGSTQQTPIFFDNHLFGVRERDKQLVCLDLAGNEVWKSGSRNKFGLGPYMIADGLIFVLDDSGVLTAAEASPAGYKPLARAQVLDGNDAWGPMALVGGRLIVRDLTRMACLDVSTGGGR
jgi:outer membrane protein assembly factor BamB